MACESLEERIVLSTSSLLARGLATTPLKTTPVSDGSPVATAPGGSSAVATVSAAPPYPLASTFQLHSLPGADLVIYLDFNGHVTSGTAWNQQFTGGADIISPAFDIDGSPTTFSASEREYIQHVWQRVSEDFAPFNVDVTTEDPGVERLRKSGGGDTQWGVRSIQTTDFGTGAGGIAFLGSFSWDSDTPVFVFNGSTGITPFLESVAADTHSHEIGHSLGLSHDGQFSLNYYGGHGTGPTGWAPIMGAGFGQALSQWSQGEYPGANEMEDDLEIITNPALNGAGWGYSGLTYKTDDRGNTNATATALVEGVSSYGPTFTGNGLIETRTDVDVFSFDWIGGAFSISVDPFERGPNLDILATLYGATGNFIASSNPFSTLNATVNAFLAAGRYYLHVDGVGKPRSGSDYGYSDYGSLGWYTITTPPPYDDRYEENDVRGLASDPRNNGGNWEGQWLTTTNGFARAQDEDWYVINVKPGQLRVRAELTFIDANGDLDLWLVNSAGVVVAKSESVTDNEFIDTVVASAGTYYLLVRPYANETGNLYDLRWFDDIPVSTVNLAVGPNSTPEDGTGNLTFTFNRTLNLSQALTVNFAVSGAAKFGTDYTVSGATSFTMTTGSVTFAAGSSVATVVIDPTADTTVELDEDVVLTIVTGTGYEVGLNSLATATITNDDRAKVFVNDVSVFEGNSGTTALVFTLTLDRAVDTDFFVLYNTADGTAVAPEDYIAVSSSATFVGTAGETVTITVLVNGDLNVEPDQMFELVLNGIMTNGRNIVLDRQRATGTILNDETAPGAASNLKASDTRIDHVVVTWTAGVGASTYDVYRSTSSTFDPAATPKIATDFVGTSFNDTTAAAGTTYFYWVIAKNTFGASAVSNSDSGIVLPTVTQSVVAPDSMAEDAAGTLVFTFTRNGSTAQALTVKFIVGGDARFGTGKDYTVTGAATFTATAGTVTFAVGSATATIAIDPNADDFYEADELVVLRLIAGDGYALGVKPAASATITNDDLKPRLGFVAAPNAGHVPDVLVFDETGNDVRLTVSAYVAHFLGGVQVATGDVNGDGVFDIVVAPVSGAAPVRVFSGTDGTMLRSFFPFKDSPALSPELTADFTGGYSVAVGDVDGDGFADIIVAPSTAASPYVRVFSGRTGVILQTFTALDNLNFKGGLQVAAGDADGDGKAEVFVTPTKNALPFVRVFDPLTGTVRNAFYAFKSQSYYGGLTVAAGDVNADGKSEVIVGLASLSEPAVRVLDPLARTGTDVGSVLKAFYAFDATTSGVKGVNVGVADFNADGRAEILVAARTGPSASVRRFDGMTGTMLGEKETYSGFTGGMFAAGETTKAVAVPGALASAPSGAKAAAAPATPSGTASFAASPPVASEDDSPKLGALPQPGDLDDLFGDEYQLEALLTA